ncbi:hemerythrin domain-containing protein [Kitasatospora sp. RB6PN24]|uniref:hemerythrin domain-containing protein n=1 Tax=Kitasatospora humi TaxID=2893891 RepID=UPI001E43AC7F|nr:hemerythrin domain-containing protein [Kitasatospora humi]MCC9308693.1 hemerythrin domain-containing protein [Kitasatospora humi]
MQSHLLSVPAQRGASEAVPAVRPVRFAGLRLVHAALRRDLARIPTALRLLQPDDEASAEALQRHWDFLTAMLTCHHEQQDGRIWPLLRRFAPELRLLINWLEDDHHNLDHSFTRTTTLMRIATRDPASAWPVAYAVEELAARLETHLRIEEEQVLPVMALQLSPQSRVGTLGELLDLLRLADGPGAPDALAWLLEGVAPEQVDALLAECDDLTARQWPHPRRWFWPGEVPESDGMITKDEQMSKAIDAWVEDHLATSPQWTPEQYAGVRQHLEGDAPSGEG